MADSEKTTWKVIRKYHHSFSCEDAVRKLIEVHVKTGEDGDVQKKHALLASQCDR